MISFTEQRQSSEALRSIYADLCLECGVCCVVYNSADKWAIGTSGRAPVPRKLVQIGPRRKSGNTYLRTVPLTDKVFSGNQQYQKCIALEGTVRSSAKCGIYAVRPACCSNFDPGSLACIASREWAKMSHPEDAFCLGRS